MYTPETQHGTWKDVPGKGYSCWKPSFSFIFRFHVKFRGSISAIQTLQFFRYLYGVCQNPGLQWVNHPLLILYFYEGKAVNLSSRISTSEAAGPIVDNFQRWDMLAAYRVLVCSKKISNGRTHWTDTQIKTWVSHSSDRNLLNERGPVRFGPIQIFG